MRFCMVGGLREVVLRFKFHQNRLSGFAAVGIEIFPSPLTWSLAYTSTTACTTTVQAVINSVSRVRLLVLYFFVLTTYDSCGHTLSRNGISRLIISLARNFQYWCQKFPPQAHVSAHAHAVKIWQIYPKCCQIAKISISCCR